MKSFQSFKMVIILCAFTWSSNVMAQCTGGTQNGSLDPVTSTFQFFSTGVAGEYQTFTAVFGEQYEFSYCSSEGGSSFYDTELSLNDAFGANIAYDDDFCGSQSHLTWTANSSGTFRIYTTEFECVTNATTSILAYRTVVVIGVEEKSPLESVHISPNPSSGLVSLKLEDFHADRLEISITDLSGRTVLNEGIAVEGTYQAVYDLSSVTKGMYLMTLNSGKFTRTEKLFLQ